MALSKEHEKRVFDAVQSLKTIINTNFNPDVDITKTMLNEVTTIEEVYSLSEGSGQPAVDPTEEPKQNPSDDEEQTPLDVPAKPSKLKQLGKSLLPTKK